MPRALAIRRMQSKIIAVWRLIVWDGLHPIVLGLEYASFIFLSRPAESTTRGATKLARFRWGARGRAWRRALPWGELIQAHNRATSE